MGVDRPINYKQWFTLNLTVKDGRYRAVFSDFDVSGVVITANEIPKNDIPIERHLFAIPASYNFDKLDRDGKLTITIAKEVVLNAKKDAEGIFESMRKAVNNGLSPLRDDF